MPVAVEFLTTQQVAERLGITRGRVHQLVDKGRLKPEKAGPILLFHARDIDEFAKRPRPNGRPRKSA